jgi:hypothetical protein
MDSIRAMGLIIPLVPENTLSAPVFECAVGWRVTLEESCVGF